MLENSEEFVVSLFGILKAGGVFVPVNPTMKTAKLAYILGQCEVSCLVAHARHARVVVPALDRSSTVAAALWVGGVPPAALLGLAFDDVLEAPTGPPADPGLIDADLAAIIYTSGSTGEPKGAMLTHATMHNNAWAISTYLANTPDDVVVCVLPLAFSYGLFQVLAGARVGYSLLLERSFAYPIDVLRRIAEYEVTGFPGVPAVFRDDAPARALRRSRSLEASLHHERRGTSPAGARSAPPGAVSAHRDLLHVRTDRVHACVVPGPRAALRQGLVGREGHAEHRGVHR